MSNDCKREPANEPLDLERLLVERQRAGDIDGMLALFEADAILDTGDGPFIQGRESIRALFEEFVASGEKMTLGKQSPAVINGDLALTSTQCADGSITAEVARRQSDGTWLWVIDKYSVT